MNLQIQSSLAVLFFISSSVLGCMDICTQQFNMEMQAALAGDAAIATALSCTAITNHIKCLQRVEAQCSLNTDLQILHQTTLATALQKYQHFCHTGSRLDNTANCAGRFMACNEQLNNTFNAALTSLDIQRACASLNNYSSCVENLISLPNCGQLSTQAMQTVALLRSKYGPSCQGDLAKEGRNIANCMNRTMECFDSFKFSFSFAVNASDMTSMCQALDQYTSCVEKLRADTTCSQYIDHALVNIEILRSQHRLACGPDNGVKANQCINTFKVCFSHFNHSLYPTSQDRSGFSNICGSLSNYSRCVAGIPQDCVQYIGQPIESLNMLKRQYSEYCNPEFQKMLSCSVLTQCNRNLLGNITGGMNFQVSSMCTVLEHYFRCVDKAVTTCHLAQSGTTISFKDLGLVASRYCKTILTQAPLSNCIELLSCHMNYNMTSATPTMLIDGTYWCRYLQTAITCSKRVITHDRCPSIDKQHVLNTFQHFESMAQATCSPEKEKEREKSLPPLKITTPIPETKGKSSQQGANSAEFPLSNIFSMITIFLLSTVVKENL